jgi:hypothetical protein
MSDITPGLTAPVPSTCKGDADRNRSMRRRVVVAATIGNTLEWYDFLIYGFLAVTIAQTVLSDRK